MDKMHNKQKMRDLEEKAHQDYRNHLGQILLVDVIDGYVGDPDSGDSHSWNLNGPLKVRVTTTQNYDICRWHDDWLDPIWNVELVDASDELKDGRNFWVHGISYAIDGRIEVTTTWKVENAQS